MSIPSEDRLKEIYGDQFLAAEERYRNLETEFQKHFGEGRISYFSAPGRTEIIGNHTDHNGGKILAASITMDTICAAAKTSDDKITIISEGYPDTICVDLTSLREVPHCQGSVSLVAGMMEGMKHFGCKTGGFQAYVSTQVISSAGVSSSASFEMLICAVMNAFYNEGNLDTSTYARIGQYAENHYWEKASGLMDQMACAVGGTILLDFSDGVSCEPVDFSYDDLDCSLVIVNTGKGHADLSEEYSSVPKEMRMAAEALGVENLCDTTEEALLGQLVKVRETLGCDRAILRALHYFEECRRVDAAKEAIDAGDSSKILSIIRDSGNSSWKYLQNCVVTGDKAEQSIPLALSLTEIYLDRIKAGVCRVHGGGFAGVIMTALPKNQADEYITYMTPYFGKENIYKMGIRKTGAVEV